MNLRMRGFSLIELMIALLIGSLLMVGIFHVLFGAKESYRIQDELSRTQENARFAAEFIARDLRMAGLRGCRPGLPITSMVNNSGDWRYDLSQPLRGYRGVANYPSQFGVSAAVPAFSNSHHDPDALSILRVEPDQALAVTAENAGALTLTANHHFAQGSVMVVANCEQLSLFQVSHNDVGTTQLRHAVQPG